MAIHQRRIWRTAADVRTNSILSLPSPHPHREFVENGLVAVGHDRTAGPHQRLTRHPYLRTVRLTHSCSLGPLEARSVHGHAHHNSLRVLPIRCEQLHGLGPHCPTSDRSVANAAQVTAQAHAVGCSMPQPLVSSYISSACGLVHKQARTCFKTLND